jgi:hypothetical protein
MPDDIVERSNGTWEIPDYGVYLTRDRAVRALDGRWKAELEVAAEKLRELGEIEAANLALAALNEDRDAGA